MLPYGISDFRDVKLLSTSTIEDDSILKSQTKPMNLAFQVAYFVGIAVFGVVEKF